MSASKDAKLDPGKRTPTSYAAAAGAGEGAYEGAMVLVSRAAAAGAGLLASAVVGPREVSAGAVVGSRGDDTRDSKGSAALGVAAGAAGGRVATLLRSVGIGRGKMLRLRIPYSFSISCAVTTGLITGTSLIQSDANTAEWNALLALYDEYRLHGGKVDFVLPYQVPVPGATGSTPDTALFVLGYDPVDATALTSVRQGCELQQHVLIGAGCRASSAANSNVMVQTFVANRPSGCFQFLFRTSAVKALAVNASGAVTAMPGGWKSMNAAGSNITDGVLKTYGTSDYATAAGCVVGIVELDVEFRSRK